MPRVLTIAGSDSGGGAGIQADLKTCLACGVFGASAVTALTSQNTHGVHGVRPTAADFLRQQINDVLSDIGADVVKTGMLPGVEVCIPTLAQSQPSSLSTNLLWWMSASCMTHLCAASATAPYILVPFRFVPKVFRGCTCSETHTPSTQLFRAYVVT